MRLREWLDTTGHSPEWLAAKLGRNSRTVRKWINGSAHPRYERDFRRLDEITGGKVTANDVLFRPVPKRPVGRPRMTAKAA